MFVVGYFPPNTSPGTDFKFDQTYLFAMVLLRERKGLTAQRMKEPPTEPRPSHSTPSLLCACSCFGQWPTLLSSASANAM